GPCRFFLSCHGGPPGRPSFPTRRSSDLDVRFEPGSALVAGEDGLDDIRHIIVQAPAHLQSAGWLLLEHGYDQAEAVRTLLSEGGFVAVESRRDYGGHERISLGRRNRGNNEC